MSSGPSRARAPVGHRAFGRRRDGSAIAIAIARAACACTCMLAVACLVGCRPRYARSLTVDDAIGIADAAQAPLAPAARADADDPRPRARSHVLLGIDFARPLRLPECPKYYDRFDRPARTCAYLGKLDHKPFKIEFEDGVVPDFMKWNNASIATDPRGRPQMIRFDIGSDRVLQGKAVDAMLEKFGPPTSVTNATGKTKVGTWRHRDYVIQYFFDPDGAAVQMETRKFHDAPVVAADADAANRAKL